MVVADTPISEFNPRRMLTGVLLILSLIGLSLASLPLIQSMKPSARADAALPRIDISSLSPGEFAIFKQSHPVRFLNYYNSILIYKRNNNEVLAWVVPVKEGKVVMPDFHWWQYPAYLCSKFGPTMINGVVDESLPIQCHDTETPKWWRDKWQWGFNGKNLNRQVDNLRRINGTIETRYFVLHKD